MSTNLIRKFLDLIKENFLRIQDGIIILIILYLGVQLLLALLYPSNKSSNLYTTDFLCKDTADSRNNTKYILLWNSFFTSQNWYLSSDKIAEDFFKHANCPETRCIVTSRRDIKSYQDFDALLFHVPTFRGERPLFRKQKQIYIFASRETGNFYARKDYIKNINGYFNITSEITIFPPISLIYQNIFSALPN
jgi:hypothetical protein